MRRMFSAISVVMILAAAGPASAGGGTLDKDAIRAVVRAHIGEVKACYDAGLQRDPQLAGRIVVGFEISTSGAVSGAKIAESTLADAQVGACVAAAVQGWTFPQPQGGSLAVSYPFLFTVE